MQKLRKLFGGPHEMAFAVSGLALIGFYLFYARKYIKQAPKQKQNNELDLNLHKLIKGHHRGNTLKPKRVHQSDYYKAQAIPPGSRSQHFGKLRSNNHIIQPLKLFHSGSEVFMSTLSANDDDDEEEFISYYENALKCQLVIEKTIVDINRIKNVDQPIYLICDTNSIDLKVNTDILLWNKFLSTTNTNEEDLKNNYQIVFHIKTTEKERIQGFKKRTTEDANDNQDLRIGKAWKGFENYYPIQYDTYLMLEQNVQNAMEQIVDKMRQFLPEGASYVRKRVFAKQL